MNKEGRNMFLSKNRNTINKRGFLFLKTAFCFILIYSIFTQLTNAQKNEEPKERMS